MLPRSLHPGAARGTQTARSAQGLAGTGGEDSLAVEKILQGGEVVAVGVRDRTEAQPAMFPGNPLIAVHRAGILLHVLGGIGPKKKTDEMLAPAINQNDDGSFLAKLDPDAD